jgi:hypothetical protein
VEKGRGGERERWRKGGERTFALKPLFANAPNEIRTIQTPELKI